MQSSPTRTFRGKKTFGLEFQDQPVLAIDRVRYFGEAVAVVTADDPEQARRAAAAVQVEYEVLAVVSDVERALDQDPISRGSADRGSRIRRGRSPERPRATS